MSLGLGVSLLLLFSLGAPAQSQITGLSGNIRSAATRLPVKASVRIFQPPPPNAAVRGPVANPKMPDNPPINAIPSGAPALIGAPIYRTSTQPDGTFIVDLKPGNYLVCIQPDDFEHLDPCRWSRPTSAFIAATATSKTSLGSLSLEKGVPVRVILDDPNLLLGDETQVRLGARVQVGFQYPNGIFEPFRLESAGVVGNGFTYQYAAALPVARDLKVTLITHRIQLMDERNNPVRLNGASYPILLLASERERVLRFRAVSTVPGGAR